MFCALAAIAGLAFLLNPLLIELTHLAIYGALAIFILSAINGTTQRRLLAALLISCAVSLCDECLQGIHPQRFFDLRDLCFNLLGTVLGISLTLPLFLKAHRIRSSHKTPVVSNS